MKKKERKKEENEKEKITKQTTESCLLMCIYIYIAENLILIVKLTCWMVTSVEHWKKKKISIFSTMSSPCARMCVCVCASICVRALIKNLHVFLHSNSLSFKMQHLLQFLSNWRVVDIEIFLSLSLCTHSFCFSERKIFFDWNPKDIDDELARLFSSRIIQYAMVCCRHFKAK